MIDNYIFIQKIKDLNGICTNTILAGHMTLLLVTEEPIYQR